MGILIDCEYMSKTLSPPHESFLNTSSGTRAPQPSPYPVLQRRFKKKKKSQKANAFQAEW